MALIKYQTDENIVSDRNIVTDVLTIDNKDLLLVSLLEKLCQVVNDKNVLFKKICKYLYKIGIITDADAYADDQETLRKLYSNYLSQIIQKMNSEQTGDKSLRKHKQNKCRCLRKPETSDLQVTCATPFKQINNGINVVSSQYSNAFIEMEKIGDGGFGEVYKVYNYLDSQKYAIKKVPFCDINDPNNMRAFNEVRCLATLAHENIVRYHTTWLELCDKKTDMIPDADTIIYPVLYIQMELCACNLRDYMMKRNYSGNPNTFELEKQFIKGIISGLKYIHKHNVLHRDLNPNNIFLTEDMTPKLGDFGMSVKMDAVDDVTQMSSELGVQLYMPPEYITENIYTAKSDVYSAGIIFFELLHVFTTDMERYKIISEIRKNNLSNIKFDTTLPEMSEYHNLISSMIAETMDERLSSNELNI